jgi:hypothetical protein
VSVDIYRPAPYSLPGAAVRLSALGPYFVDAQGAIVTRRSITGFAAPKRFATGEGDKALRYLDWAMARRLNEVRAFTRVDWTGPPGPGVEPGWGYDEAACVRTLAEAGARGLGVELVAHTGRYGTVQEMAAHLQRVDELCLAHDNARLEVYNEPQQNGGHDLVDAILDIYVPRTPGWSSGVYDPTPYTPKGRAGASMSYHSPRKAEWSRCTKDAIEYGSGQGPNVAFAPGYPGAVMLDEPPQVEQTLRDAVWDGADDWRAYGAGCRLFGCGGTVHGNPAFQRCEVPEDARVTACVDAFVVGIDDVPVQRYHGYFRGDPPGTDPGSRRYNRWGDDGVKYELCVRPYSFRAVG